MNKNLGNENQTTLTGSSNNSPEAVAVGGLESQRFTISRHEFSGYYQVSIPNYGGGEVVRAEDCDRARNGGLFRAVEILSNIRLSNGDEERDAWSAIREAIKSIEAEI